MLDLAKYRAEIEKRVRDIEVGVSNTVHDVRDYAQMVGNKIGLLHALEILQQTLVEQDEHEAEDDQDHENAG